jgi:nicotinamide mononucleotide transporter
VPGVSAAEWAVMAVTATALIAASSLQWWSIPLIESLGFVTGGICVWLVVREHPANWPVGLANNVAFGLLFWNSRLYADMCLQGVYAAIALYGWWNWTLGRRLEAPLPITRARAWEWGMLSAWIPLTTWILHVGLVRVGGASPFLDALTTAISLAAQYLLAMKRIENWWLWIAVDIIYVPLYVSRDLPLTAVLYSLFLAMCIIGLMQWTNRATIAKQ